MLTFLGGSSGLANLKTANKDYQAYGLALKRERETLLYYPTFCPTNAGLRLFSTKFIIDKGDRIGHTSQDYRMWLSRVSDNSV